MSLNWTRDWNSLIGDFRYEDDDAEEFLGVLQRNLKSIEEYIEALYWVMINRPEFVYGISERIQEMSDELDIDEKDASLREKEYKYVKKVIDKLEGCNVSNVNGNTVYIKSWSRDWDKFDWRAIESKLDETDSITRDNSADFADAIGLTREDFYEYMQWMSEKHPQELMHYQMELILTKEYGLSPEEANELLSDDKRLKEIIRRLKE